MHADKCTYAVRQSCCCQAMLAHFVAIRRCRRQMLTLPPPNVTAANRFGIRHVHVFYYVLSLLLAVVIVIVFDFAGLGFYVVFAFAFQLESGQRQERHATHAPMTNKHCVTVVSVALKIYMYMYRV